MKRPSLLPILAVMACTMTMLPAQSIWNSTTGDWFTAGNWTPLGVPDTNIKAQINNGGTAQITAAGANANTLYLGNGVVESGNLTVSGAGTLTINGTTGFYMVVGESGTGTATISGGGTVSPPVLYIGDLTGSMGTITVTGAGSLLNALYDIEVGRSGQGTLKVLDGGTAATSTLNVGNGTGSGTIMVDGTTGLTTTLTAAGTNIGGYSLGSTGQVTITGAKAMYNGGGVDVGSAGDGTLTVSAGATGKSTSMLIGDAGMGTVKLTDSGTTFTVSNSSTTGTVTVGGAAVGNLSVEAGAVLTSNLGVIGKNPGGIGTATITGAGSSWSLNAFSTLFIGQSSAPGGSGTLNILNGGKFSAANLDAYTDTTIKVDGTGSQLLLPNDSPANKSLLIGSAGVNKLDVTNGGTLATGSTILNTTATSSLAINLAGTGSSWTQTQFIGTLTTQFGGAGTGSFKVSDHATFSLAQDGTFNVDATGTGTASLTVSSGGSFSVGTTSGTLRIGQDGAGSLTIDSGGTVNTAHTYVGEDTGAVGTAMVTGTGSLWNAHDLNVGILGGTGTVTVSGGATLTGDAGIGSYSPTVGSGKVTVTGTGSTWTVNPSSPTLNNFIFVETNGSLIIEAGGTVTGSQISADKNGSILVDGSGTKLNHGSLSASGTGSIKIQNQALVSGTSSLSGKNEGDNTLITVDGAGTQWNMTGLLIVGDFGQGTLNIQNGAKVTNGQIYLGYDQNSDHTGGNGIVNVTGTGSSWQASSYLRVADYFYTSGTLTISQGGTVTSVSGGSSGSFSGIGSTNNSNGAIVVTGANSSWTNTGSVYVGNGGTTGVGTLTVADSGTVTLTGALSINSGSTLNIGTGSLPGTFSASSVANNGLIHFNHTENFTYSTPTSGTGMVTKDGSGTTIIAGTSTYTGATTVNQGILKAGSITGFAPSSAFLVGLGTTLDLAGFGNTIGSLADGTGGGGIVTNSSATPATLTSGGDNTSTAFSGTLSDGSGNLAFTKTGTGTQVFSGSNSYTGATTVNLGILKAGSTTGFASSSAFLVDQGTTLDLAGFSNTIGSLADGMAGGGIVTNSTATPATLTSGGNNTSTAFSGTLSDGAGTLAFTKTGTGTQVFSGSSSYTSATLVNAGTLQVDGTLGNTAVSVASGATLGGVGSIGGPVTIQNGGILAPGDSPGTITVASLILNSGSILNYQLGTSGVIGSGVNDLTKVTGALTLDGTLNVSALTGFGAGIYRLIDYGGALTDQGLAQGTLPSGHTYNITAAGGQVNLLVDAGNIAYWDGPNIVANNVVDGGTGTWDNSLTNWTNSTGSINAQWNNLTAIFSGTAGTVTSGANISFQGMQFMTDGYVINPDAGHNFSLTPVGSAPITVDASVTATIAAPLIGGGGITKLGSGTLLLTGTSTYTGGTTISAGTLQLGDNSHTGVIVSTVVNSSIFNVVNADTTGITSITTEATATTNFVNATSAGTATLTNNGGTVSGGDGATLQFFNTATAGTATLTNHAAIVADAHGALTIFADAGTSAGGSLITNEGGAVVNAGIGKTEFLNGATAATATVINNGTTTVSMFLVGGGGATEFYDNSTAAHGTFTNNPSLSSSPFTLPIGGGLTSFFNSSTADHGDFTNNGAALYSNYVGITEFSGNSTAALGTFHNNPGTGSGAEGGGTIFSGSSTAATATLLNQGASFSGAHGGFTEFLGSSTADHATITNFGGVVTGPGGGFTVFHDSTTADHATIVNNAGSASGATGGLTSFDSMASAGSGIFTNNGGAVSGALGGGTQFTESSNAGTGMTPATFTNRGATVSGAGGGSTQFFNASSAGNATLIANGGSGGGQGGLIAFLNDSTGGTARIIVGGNGSMDISQHHAPGVTVGSIEGSGNVFLGGANLTVGGNDLDKEFFGSIQDGGMGGGTGGSLTKTGTGTLILSGTSTYTGATTVNQGILKAGSITGFAPSSAFLVGLGTTLDLAGFGNTIGSFADGMAGGGIVTNSSATPATVTSGGDNTSTAFSGTLANGASTLSFTKTGTGTQILSGASTYTGATLINAGTLQVDGTLGNSAVSVASGATLGGVGSIGGAVTIQNGGILAPGDGPGTITVASLILNSGSILNYQLGTSGVIGSGVNDLTEVTGALTLDGTLNVSALTGFGAGIYRLIDYGGALTDNILSVGTSPGGHTYGITAAGGQVNLLVDAGNLAYWDGPNIVANNVVDGGTGTWDNSLTNWTNSTGSINAQWNNLTAIFSGTAGTVTLGANISFQGMQFMTDGYVINPDAGHTFSLQPSGSAPLTVNPTLTATIAAPLTGGGGITKLGSGTLILTGTSTYTGGTTISAGTLQVTGGGQITQTSAVTVDGLVASDATLKVDGTGGGASVVSTSNVTVGDTAKGTMKLLAGGTVASTGQSLIGNQVGSDGTVLVDGTNSKWTNTGNLSVGLKGTGHLTIQNGAEVANSIAYLGDLAGSNGTAVVDGANSKWTNNGSLFVGNFSTGKLTIQNGGSVSSSGGFVGNQANVTGTALVTGTGSSWTIGSSLTVGRFSTGVITIENDGLVSVNSGTGTVTLGENAASSGTLNIGSGGNPGVLEAASVTGGAGTAVLNFNHIDSAYAFSPNIAGTVSVNQIGSGTTLLNGADSYTGPTAVDHGILQAGSTASFSPASAFKVNSGAILDVKGFSNTIGSLADGTGGGGTVTNSGVANAVLTVGQNNASTSFSGVIADGTGGLALTKIGLGKLVLSGINTYSGNTNVNGGTLAVNGSTVSANTFVNAGGTLGGTGILTGHVTVANGGTLAPGNSPGTLTVGSLVLNSGSKLAYELGTPGIVGSGVNDLTTVNGDLTLSGTLNITALSGFGVGTFRIFDYLGSLTDNVLSIGTAPGGYLFNVDTSVASQVNLDVTGGGPLPIAYWNGAHTTPNGIVNGGSGIWNNSSMNWTDAAGSVSGIWGGVTGTFAGAAGTVTLGDNIAFKHLIFVTSGYHVNGAGYSLLIPGQATITTNAGVFATINAPIIGPGSLTKDGAGTLNLTGASSIGGNTYINAGSLLVNGSLATPLLFVNRYGLLGGSGTIFGKVRNDGTVNPGNGGPGTLTIKGNYTQTSHGTLVLETQSASVHDRLIVSGTARLAGTLNVQNYGGHKFAYGDYIQGFLQAGRITGKFDRVTMPQSGYRGRVINDGSTLSLLAAPSSYTLVAHNSSDVSLAKALDKWIGTETGDVGDVTLSLDFLRADQYAQAFAAISPAYYGSLARTGIEQTISQRELLGQRMSALRYGAKGVSVLGVEMSGKSPGDSKQVVQSDSDAERWSSFVQLSGQFADLKDISSLPGTSFNTGGVLVGADYRISKRSAIGVSIGYDLSSLDQDANDRTEINDARLSAYGTFDLGRGFFINGTVGGAWSSYDVARPVQYGFIDRTARSSTNGGQVFAAVEFGRDIQAGKWTLTPSTGFQFTHLNVNGLTETNAGALNLKVDDYNAESFRYGLGAQVSYHTQLSDRVLMSPYLQASWQHEFSNVGVPLHASLSEGGGAFDYNAAPLQRDRVLAGAGLNFLMGTSTSLNLGYQADFGSSDYISHLVYTQLSIRF